ncbi:MAG TPA: hypothetical protein VGC76_01500 [Pyrinomonadaceae bacterium]|jgi:hypothetical protein
MENTGKLHSQEIKIQGLIDRYLRAKTAGNNLSEAQHLDEDSLTAFVEGNLGKRESQPIVSHLVDCSFCRHITAELVRLDLAFAIEEIPLDAVGEQPAKISEVISGFLGRIFGTNDGAVFALGEEEEEKTEEEKKPEGEE